jgi:hypothetical protein
VPRRRRLTLQEQQARFAELVTRLAGGLPPASLEYLVAAQQGDRGDGGALVFVLDTPDGQVLYKDTSGTARAVLRDLRPDVAILAAGRGNVDGEPIQGSLAQFVAREAELLGPRRVVLAHHDDWLPGFSVATDVEPIRDALLKVDPDTELLERGYVDGTVILP